LQIQEEDDPLKKNLMDTIVQYEKLLKNNDFKNKEEKEVANKLVTSLRKQLKEYEQRKTQTIKGSANATKYPALTKEELRDKGLKEIFHFYARQHIPHGIAFEDLEVIMNQIDLGEFTSF
jgi:5'-deoxynucleotidase YfbR-like HD superfamily hydrolase